MSAIDLKQKLKEVIALTCTYYGKQITEDLLQMYYEDLADLDPSLCINAYGQWRRNPENKFCPLPAQIRELVNPNEFVAVEAQAREIAARIVGAIPKFGWSGAKEAQVYVGPHGWEIVSRHGGWRYLCENVGLSINPTTLQAQLRDQLEGTLRYGSQVIESSIGALPESRARGGNDLTPIGDALKLLPISDPDGAA
jgi:hypothetical protein